MPSLEGTDEGEFADALVRVVSIENREALVTSEAGGVEGFDEGGKFVTGEERLMRDWKGAEVEDGAVDASFAASAGDSMEGFTAGNEVEVGAGIETDEVV